MQDFIQAHACCHAASRMLHHARLCSCRLCSVRVRWLRWQACCGECACHATRPLVRILFPSCQTRQSRGSKAFSHITCHLQWHTEHIYIHHQDFTQSVIYTYVYTCIYAVFFPSMQRVDIHIEDSRGMFPWFLPTQNTTSSLGRAIASHHLASEPEPTCPPQ